jgi:hypothetical protein
MPLSRILLASAVALTTPHEHICQKAGPHAALRNQIMGAKSPTERLDTLAWLYGSTGLDGRSRGSAWMRCQRVRCWNASPRANSVASSS